MKNIIKKVFSIFAIFLKLLLFTNIPYYVLILCFYNVLVATNYKYRSLTVVNFVGYFIKLLLFNIFILSFFYNKFSNSRVIISIYFFLVMLFDTIRTYEKPCLLVEAKHNKLYLKKP